MSATQRATRLAAATPAERRRAIDFFRALAIVLVVGGHWLVAAPWVTPHGGLEAGQMLEIAPWSRWLTWVFQVMPLFFAVGGFANAASWRSARRRGSSYAQWAAGRLRRLALPVLPLLAAWVAIALGTTAGGAPSSIIRTGSQVALVPVWFLAVYIGATLMAPAAIAAWERAGWTTFAVVAALAVTADALALGGGWSWVGWTNFVWVWVAAHLLGFAWKDDRLPHPAILTAAGLGGLAVMVAFLGYPLSMVGVPGEAVTNTYPPTAALLALGTVHVGLARFAEPRLERWLRGTRPWTATVLVNSSIMTLYLWHLTAMVLITGGAVLLGGIGLHLVPNTAAWWWLRPAWLAVNLAGTIPLVLVAAPVERSATGRAQANHPALVVGGGVLIVVGLSAVALGGIIGPSNGLHWWSIALPFGGALLAGVLGRTRAWGPRGTPHRDSAAPPSRPDRPLHGTNAGR